MKYFFRVKKHTIDVDLIIFLVRLACGYAFMLHGFGKIQNPLHWMGPDSAMPSVFQALAALSEFGGGLALILGLVMRLAATGIGCTMAVAVYTHKVVMGDPFVNMTGGRSYELAAIFFLIALLLVVLGPGRFSLDRKLFGTKIK